jgi:translation elongation factor P/translation initiation factor 5A
MTIIRNPVIQDSLGFRVADELEQGNRPRRATYEDVRVANCTGSIPNGNCAGNVFWDMPNGNWWTWGISGVPGGNCQQGAGNANCSNNLYSWASGASYGNCTFGWPQSYIYSGYSLIETRDGVDRYQRTLRNCNCGSWNCYTNCNCNCACNCTCSVPEGTKVKLGDGTLSNVQDLKAGDVVLGLDDKKNKILRVVECHVGEHEVTYTINNQIRVTGEHLVYNGKNWVAVSLDGYKAFAEKYKERTGKEPSVAVEGLAQLNVGDSILIDGRMTRVFFIDSVMTGKETLYTVDVGGNKTWHANGVVLESMTEKGAE